MLSIKLNGQPVVLKEDFSFSMTRENPIFNDPEALAGDYIESMTFPMEGNRLIFQNSNRISSNTRGVDYEIAIYFNGYHLVTGTFTVKSAGADYISGDAKLNALSFFYKIKDLKMTDIPDEEGFNLGGLTFNVKEQINKISRGEVADYDNHLKVAFPPLYNEEFYDDEDGKTSFDYNGVVNEYGGIATVYGTGHEHIFNHADLESGALVIVPFVPCFYLSYLMKTMVKIQQYSITMPKHPLFDKLILATNRDIIQTNGERLSVLVDSEAYAEASNSEWTILNHYAINDYYGMLQDDTTFIIKESGFYKIEFSLRQLTDWQAPEGENVTNIKIESSEGKDIYVTNEQAILFVQNETFTISGNSTPGYTIITGKISIVSVNDIFEYNIGVTLNKHVPGIEQLKLFTIIKGIFNAGFFINDAKREIETVTFNEIIEKYPARLNIKIGADWSIDKEQKGVEVKYGNSYTEEEHAKIEYEVSTVDQLPKAAIVGSYAHVINEGNVYYYNDDYEWEFFSILNEEKKTEEDEMVSFDIPFELANMIHTEREVKIKHGSVIKFQEFYLMPQTKGKGISIFNPKSDDDDFSILIYHGLQDVSNIPASTQYPKGPFASITKYDGHCNVINENYSLMLDDIVKNFHQSFINFIRTSREVKFKTKMKIVDFMKLRLQEKYAADGYVFIIKSIKMNITVKDYSFVEMVIAVI